MPFTGSLLSFADGRGTQRASTVLRTEEAGGFGTRRREAAGSESTMWRRKLNFCAYCDKQIPNWIERNLSWWHPSSFSFPFCRSPLNFIIRRRKLSGCERTSDRDFREIKQMIYSVCSGPKDSANRINFCPFKRIISVWVAKAKSNGTPDIKEILLRSPLIPLIHVESTTARRTFTRRSWRRLTALINYKISLFHSRRKWKGGKIVDSYPIRLCNNAKNSALTLRERILA